MESEKQIAFPSSLLLQSENDCLGGESFFSIRWMDNAG